ncbi:hypothetical protein FKM82_026359 [Ascaphus truei]
MKQSPRREEPQLYNTCSSGSSTRTRLSVSSGWSGRARPISHWEHREHWELLVGPVVTLCRIRRSEPCRTCRWLVMATKTKGSCPSLEIRF